MLITAMREIDLASGFRSGKPALDAHFASAWANQQRYQSRTFVLRTNKMPVMGFFTLSVIDITGDHLHESVLRQKLTMVRIERLAVDERCQGKGYGRKLMRDVIGQARFVGNEIMSFGIVAEAHDAQAEAFYAKYDFVTTSQGEFPRRMLLAMKKCEHGSVETAIIEEGLRSLEDKKGYTTEELMARMAERARRREANDFGDEDEDY
jgi:GNAT superfamily N-acetyltransferase